MLMIERCGACSGSFTRPIWFALFLATTQVISAQAVPKPLPAEPPLVEVSRVVEREVTDYEVFTGRFEAVEAVRVVPRVTGYLTKVAFEEGSNVKKGDLLFEIDPRPYQAQVDQAAAGIHVAEAHLKLAEAEYQRTQQLAKTAQIAPGELDKAQAAQQEARAALDAAHAVLQSQQLNLSFCQITSPIDGRIGRCNLTPGNLARQDETALTTIVSLDPIYVYFDLDERTLARLLKAPPEARAKPFRASSDFPVAVQTADETSFPHAGVVSFINNQIDPTTGTLAVRATFRNPPLNGGEPQFMPGMFAKVRIPLGQPYRALLVSDGAVRNTQGSRSVQVLSGDDQIESRAVTVGPLQDDGLRVIEQGLKPDDLVVVGSAVPPQTKARPKLVPMPTRIYLPSPRRGERGRG